MKINCKPIDDGLELQIDDRKFNIEFPEEVWKAYPQELKKIYSDNYAFLKSLHLPLMLKKDFELNYGNSYPLFKNPISNSILNHIPFYSDVDGTPTEENLKKFINLKFQFRDFDVSFPKYTKKLEEKAVVNMSFGKDSLLTYALADELGLDPSMIISVDNDCSLENVYKTDIAKRFSEEFGKKVWKIKNNTGVIHRYKYWDVPKTEVGFGHLITEYCLNALPFANYLSSRYILFGNEKGCDDSYINKDGFKSYPVYDQSSEWSRELTKMTQSMTSNQVSVMSLIEPLNDLAITKVLHQRYPEIGKYQMSCFPDENEYGKKHYWCQHCTKCARIFIFMRANGFDPKRIGFTEDMLTIEHKSLFSLFGVEKGEGLSMGWDISGLGRDEMLYAFYLAYKNGTKGDLIDEFRKKFLNEAKQREDELHEMFFTMQDSKTIPPKYLKQLQSIYKEELSK